MPQHHPQHLLRARRGRAPGPVPAPRRSGDDATAGSATATACGCPEDGPTRRSVLGALGVGALAAAAGTGTSTRVAMAAPGYTGDVLVVLSLRGGFDGLSAVAPVGDPAYAALRPDIGVPGQAALMLDRTFGLHPSLRALKPLYDSGQLGVVHAVGQASRSRSHFSAMEEMERAAPGTSLRTGWLDRTLGTRGQLSPLAALQVGSPIASSGFAGPVPEVTMRTIGTFVMDGPDTDVERARWNQALRTLHGEGPRTVSAAGLAAVDAVERLRAVPDAGARGLYPTGELGDALCDVARLVRARAGVQVVAVDSGDWDMHAGLGRHDRGWMSEKLTELGNALAAFARDLGPLMSGVTLMTLSEFGRRAGQNGSGGLDHGHANAVLMMGGGVVGGRVHGRWPGLGGSQLDDGALAGTTDYRTVVAEVLQKRCGAGSLAEVLPGLPSVAPLGVVRARA
ncbi:DUF1501 domain-containing protein [Pseudokineococcus marinus]|uniref:DUF1501 domain-containing protein n=2 Tax=Pseudokineococcus marinus TaxID=351215 RepID=A0A849BJK1_9ACTN|nr:DUF1501 domain-containing protein [Pseudokineococcus marinus]